jgi:hypothetical protein
LQNNVRMIMNLHWKLSKIVYFTRAQNTYVSKEYINQSQRNLGNYFFILVHSNQLFFIHREYVYMHSDIYPILSIFLDGLGNWVIRLRAIELNGLTQTILLWYSFTFYFFFFLILLYLTMTYKHDRGAHSCCCVCMLANIYTHKKNFFFCQTLVT